MHRARWRAKSAASAASKGWRGCFPAVGSPGGDGGLGGVCEGAAKAADWPKRLPPARAGATKVAGLAVGGKVGIVGRGAVGLQDGCFASCCAEVVGSGDWGQLDPMRRPRHGKGVNDRVGWVGVSGASVGGRGGSGGWKGGGVCVACGG